MKEKVTELIGVKNSIQEMARDWMKQSNPIMLDLLENMKHISEKEFEEKIQQLTPEQQVLVRNMRYTGVGKERVVLEKSNRKE